MERMDRRVNGRGEWKGWIEEGLKDEREYTDWG